MAEKGFTQALLRRTTPVVFRTGTGSLVQETVTGTAQCGVRIINLNLIRVNIFRFNFDRTCGSGLTLQKS